MGDLFGAISIWAVLFAALGFLFQFWPVLLLQRISNRLRPADLTPRPPLQMGAGERNCRRVQPF